MASRKFTEVSHGGSPMQKGHQFNGNDSEGPIMMGSVSNASPTSSCTATGEANNGSEGDEDGDSSTLDEQDNGVSKPDAQALPGGHVGEAQDASSRLAGKLQFSNDAISSEEAGSGSLTPTALSASKKSASAELAESPLSDISMEEADQAIEGASSLEEDGEDDDVYEGLDGISDSGNSQMDEQELEESAEKELARMYEKREARRVAKALFKEDKEDEDEMPVQPSQEASETAMEDDEQDEDVELDYTEDPFGGLDANTAMEMFPYDKEEDPLGLARGLDMNNFSFTDQLDDWRRDDFDTERRESQQSATMPKRVRFEDDVFTTRSSSFSDGSDDEQDPNDAFPDLFMSQDDPLMQQRLAMVEQEDAAADRDFNADNHSDAGSYWDFDDEERMALQMDQESGSDDSSSSSSDDGCEFGSTSD